MSNLIAIAAHCGRGEEVIVGDEQHIVVYEQGGASALFGIVYHTLPQASDGTFALRGPRPSLQFAIESRHGGIDPHYSRPALVAIENTHNRCGGAPLPQAWVDDVCSIAHGAGLAVHMDGARIFNAAAASPEADPWNAYTATVARMTRDCDSISVCISKGLGAPVGSVLIGSAQFIAKARRIRKVLGGGMRQAGVLAAAAIVAIREQVPLLEQDHVRAGALARGLARIPGIVVDPDTIHTNIVFFDLDASILSPANIDVNSLSKHSIDARVIRANMPLCTAFAALVFALSRVRVGSYGGGRLRAVTHHQVTDAAIEALIAAAATAAEIMMFHEPIAQ